jgi:hypothetical protein
MLMSAQNEETDIWNLVAEARRLQAEVMQRLPGLAEAWRNYARSRRDEDRAELDRVEKSLGELWEKQKAAVDEMSRASGIPEEVLVEGQ